MNNTAVFTITKGVKGYDLKCNAYKTYNCYGVAKKNLFSVMEQLTCTFNNFLEIAVLFDIE